MRFSLSKTWLSILGLTALPLALLLAHWVSQPFGNVLAEKNISLQPLSSAQRQNIAVAVARMDGQVLEPHSIFSFNQIVGPRTIHRGYRNAPSYIADTSAATPGGGICMLSSLLYQLALESGLSIIERSAHLRPIRTIEPGLDATVWLDKTHALDLRFQNSSAQPLLLKAFIDPKQEQLILQWKGRKPLAQFSLETHLARNANGLYVEVFRKRQASNNQGVERLSSDHYRL